MCGLSVPQHLAPYSPFTIVSKHNVETAVTNILVTQSLDNFSSCLCTKAVPQCRKGPAIVIVMERLRYPNDVGHDEDGRNS